jgi:lipopolysaccharide export system permease protein
MKKIDQLILRSFIPPFFATFFITLFVLLMQFIWKYIDDIAGKDLGFIVISKLLFYTSASLVPIALPLACLLASIMTMGALGEHFELVAFKSSGIGLGRFMRGMVFSGVVISIIAFMFSNYLIPVANLKAGSLLYDVQSSRPALNIKEGVFYNGIDGYSIRIGHKDPSGTGIHDIMIYDHTSGRGCDNVITASHGEMFMTEDKRFLSIKLVQGHHYEELPPQSTDRQGEFVRTDFDSYQRYFDLSSFSLERTNESMFKSHYQMMNLSQLKKDIDTLQLSKVQTGERLFDYIYRSFQPQFFPDTTIKELKYSGSLPAYYAASFKPLDRKNAFIKATPIARDMEAYASNAMRDNQFLDINIAKENSEWHKKFTLSIACLLLLLIGAPLGAIIRKGGLGMPLVVAVIFFVVFHVLNLGGWKMAEGLILPVWIGVWLPILVMTPIAILLIRMARNDAAVFRIEAYQQLYRKIIRIFSKEEQV